MLRRDVSAVLVTRGDVDLEPIIASLPLAWDLVVWNNAEREDLGVYGRYAALAECMHDVVYVQDDDCVTDPIEVVRAYEPGRLVANMPPLFRRWYPDSCLVGFGAVFDRGLPAKAFERWDTVTWAPHELFHRTCDVIFTGLTDRTLIDVPVRDLPYATDGSRMYRQDGHVAERRRVLKLVRRIRKATVAA